MRMQANAEEVQQIMDQQAKEDVLLTQLGSEIPHETDTEDVVADLTPSNYDKRHSKAWNQLVEKKAQELEN